MYTILFKLYKVANTLLFKCINYLINFPVGFVYDPSIVYYWGGLIQNSTGKRENIKIGKSCQIGGKITVWGSGKVVMGNHCYLNRHSKIISLKGVFIGNCCLIAQEVHIEDNNNHPLDWKVRGEDCINVVVSNDKVDKQEVIIEDNVWIGRRAIILKGVRIGKGAVVGAGSVVSKDVPPFAVVAGNPATVVGYHK